MVICAYANTRNGGCFCNTSKKHPDKPCPSKRTIEEYTKARGHPHPSTFELGDAGPACGHWFISGRVKATKERIQQRKRLCNEAHVAPENLEQYLETVWHQPAAAGKATQHRDKRQRLLSSSEPPADDGGYLVFKQNLGICGCHFRRSDFVQTLTKKGQHRACRLAEGATIVHWFGTGSRREHPLERSPDADKVAVATRHLVTDVSNLAEASRATQADIAEQGRAQLREPQAEAGCTEAQSEANMEGLLLLLASPSENSDTNEEAGSLGEGKSTTQRDMETRLSTFQGSLSWQLLCNIYFGTNDMSTNATSHGRKASGDHVAAMFHALEHDQVAFAVQLALENGKGCVYHWDGDFSCYEQSTHDTPYEYLRAHILSVAATNCLPFRFAKAQPGSPHINPDVVSVGTVDFLVDSDFGGAAFSFLEKVMAHGILQEESQQWSVEATRRRVLSFSCGDTDAEAVNRKTAGANLTSLADHPFKTTGEILRTLVEGCFAQPVLRNVLKQGHILVSVGDHAKVKIGRRLVLQAHRSPERFGELCKAAAPAVFEDIMQQEGVSEEEVKKILGECAKNLCQTNGPAHLGVHAAMDLMEAWGEPFFIQVVTARHGLDVAETFVENPPLQQTLTWLEDTLHAWALMRSSVLPVLQPIKHRPDVSAFLWMLDNQLPMAVLTYPVVFKENFSEFHQQQLCAYELQAIHKQRSNYKMDTLVQLDQILYLKEQGHPLAEFFVDNMSTIDATFGEGGIKTLLWEFLPLHLPTSDAIKEAKTRFAMAQPGHAMDLRASDDSQTEQPTEGNPDDSCNCAAHVIVEVTKRLLLAAQNGDLPTRTPTTTHSGPSSDSWKFPAINEDYTFSAHLHCAPGYALFNHPDKKSVQPHRNAPDAKDTCFGSDCTAHDDLHALHCGHRFCTACKKQLKHERCCPICQQAERDLAHEHMHQAQAYYDRDFDVADITPVKREAPTLEQSLARLQETLAKLQSAP